METWVNFRVSLTSHSSIIVGVKNDPRLGMEEQTGELYNDQPNWAVLYVIYVNSWSLWLHPKIFFESIIKGSREISSFIPSRRAAKIPTPQAEWSFLRHNAA